MERRRRAMEAEREAQARAQALLDAQIAAQEAAEAAAREAEQAHLAAIEAAEREAAEATARAEESARALAAQTVDAASDLPSWRRPFVPPPGVRFFRTPDRRPKPAEPVPVAPPIEAAEIAPEPEPVTIEMSAEISVLSAETAFDAPFIPPVPAEPSDWADVPDWSELHGWFGPGEASAPVQHTAEPHVLEIPVVAAPVDETPVFAAPVAEVAAASAERPAFWPPRAAGSTPWRPARDLPRRRVRGLERPRLRAGRGARRPRCDFVRTRLLCIGLLCIRLGAG